MFYQILISPQVKRWESNIYKHGIEELPQEFLNDFRLRNLGNQEILRMRKVSKCHRMTA